METEIITQTEAERMAERGDALDDEHEAAESERLMLEDRGWQDEGSGIPGGPGYASPEGEDKID